MMTHSINTIYLKLLLIVALIIMPFSAMPQTKRALLIGLGEQKDAKWNKINGDKDIPYVKEMLIASGFKMENMMVIANKRATKEGIVNAFTTIKNLCRRGDIVYIHFSGHGQQMTDLDGDEMKGLDEAWIPYDAYLNYGKDDNGSKHLSDDEISILLKDIRKKIGPSGKILVVVDACHSGDSTHGTGDKNEVIRGTRDSFTIPHQYIKKGKRAKTKEEWITLSACKPNQTNSELKSKAVGKLTFGLHEIIMHNNNLTNDEIEDKLRDFMDRNRGNHKQTPVISGLKDKHRISDILNNSHGYHQVTP